MSNDTLINALKQVVTAWDALPSNTYQLDQPIQQWLAYKMAPSIREVREVIAANTATAPSQPVEQAQIAKE